MANTKKRWTADEIEILRKYYPTEGDQVCERLSGRTEKSCRIQASKMEISKNISSSATVQNDVQYVRLWTEAENKILREYYAAEGSKVRYRLNQRTAESCRGRAAALGLTYSGANRKWSSSEDEILRNYYPTEGAEVQKRLEGRSKEACNKRAAKLGLCIQGRKEWTAEEDEIIRTYYKAEGRKAAERLEGRTLTACQSRAKYLNVRSDNNRLPWTQEEDAIISRYYEEKGAGYVHTLIPERSLQACKYRAMILGLSRKTNDPWTKAEEKILKKYYPVEGSNVYKRLNNRTRNACISKAAQLHLQYGQPMYKGPVLDEWIILAVKQGITKVRQSMTYSEITFKPGKLPELHLKLECDGTGKFRAYEESVLLDEKEYDRQRVENLADTMGLRIEGNKITLNSSEKEIEDDIFRLISYYRRRKKQMKKRMAILMSMAIAANMIASVPVCAADIFTDSMTTDSAIIQEAGDDSFSDGSGTPDFADEQDNVQAAQDEGTQNAKEPPEVMAEYESGFLANVCKLKTSLDYSGYVDQITGISVNGTKWNGVAGSWDLKGTTYIKKGSDGYVGLSPDTLKVGDKIVITSTGYKDLTLKVTGTGNDWAVEKVTSQTEPEQTKDAPTFAGDQVEISGTDYKIIKPADENNVSDYISKIKEISVDGTVWDKTDYAIALYGRKAYCPDSSNNRVVFDSTVLHTGNVITIKSDGYKELYLKVTAEGNDFTVVTADSGKTNINGASNGVNTLHVRLKGYFESAVTGQQKYDAVSGASTSVSSNKNSNVVVEAADLPNGQEPVEDDWKELKETGVKIDIKNTKVDIDSKSGMVGIYSTYDSSLSLSGTPAEIGTYPVSVTVTDESGHKVTSNELTFKVYSTNEKLADHLKLDNATQTADRKYMYDMDPWVIPDFNDTDDIVTVPAEIKAWYGSHTSGTYGELGYAVSEGDATTQTLIIPNGCNLTMVNMKVLSSVKIKVENGGTLNLRDSSIYGQIEVENGGTISVNHDDYSGKFLTGTSINGQLILNDGATIKNSMIYSNTNFLTDGTQARHNTSPVVVTNGNVKVEGKVYIKGDEAATGTDSATGKSYSGQPALKVSSGTLTVGEGSQLAVYGGGNIATTSVGGAAVILDNGTISGAGTLIAVAGRGHGDNGGNAVEGTGNVETAKAYLEGGSAYMNRNAEPGKAYTESVTISPSTKGTAVNGKKITSNSESAPDTYWSDITETPDNKIQNCTISDTTIIQTVNPTPSVNPSPSVNLTPSVNPTVTPVPTVAPIPDTYPEGTEKDKNGNLVTPEGIVISSDGTVTLPDGTKLTPDADGKKPTVNKDETVIDTKGNTYSTDGSITDSDGNYTRPAKAVIKNVSVSKNSVKMVLNEECKGALKYDYVIGTSEDMLKTGQYTKVLKNQEELKSAFAYMDKGTWYVACHAWFKGEDGKKVFGQWSEIHKVDVSATTPQAPVISKVTVKGSTVTVKYTKSKNSQGYDVVLSDTLTKTNGQKRPADSGENYYVKKIKGNTVTVTFKNVKSGTYYIGLHAWNRTSEDNSKTFSEWSNVRKVKMK